jgi:hypothetical protein
MSREAVVFDGVSFWDMAGERHLRVSDSRSIRDGSMVPVPGDRVSFETEEDQFLVVYREFTFRHGLCLVTVNVQPVARDES